MKAKTNKIQILNHLLGQKHISNKIQILNHLLCQKHISQLEALGVYRCFRLAAVIHELRKEGYNIQSHWSVDATGKKYKRYYLSTSNETQYASCKTLRRK